MGAEAGTWRVATWTILERRADVHDGDAGFPGATRSSNAGFLAEVRRHLLSIEHGFVEGWSAQIEASWVGVRASNPMGGDSTRGLGDTTVLVRYTRVVRPHDHRDDEPPGPVGLHLGEGRLALGVGLSIPTGDPERPSFFGPVPNSTLQTGTGTFDPSVTAVYSQSLGGASAFAGLSVKTGGGENEYEYRIGTSILGQTGVTLPVVERVDVTAKVSGLWSAADEVDGTKVFASGGTRVTAVPGIRVRLFDGVDVQAFAEVPVWRNLRTATLEPDVGWILGLTLTR